VTPGIRAPLSDCLLRNINVRIRRKCAVPHSLSSMPCLLLARKGSPEASGGPAAATTDGVGSAKLSWIPSDLGLLMAQRRQGRGRRCGRPLQGWGAVAFVDPHRPELGLWFAGDWRKLQAHQRHLDARGWTFGRRCSTRLRPPCKTSWSQVRTARGSPSDAPALLRRQCYYGVTTPDGDEYMTWSSSPTRTSGERA
jgi:hypothetical protein